MRWPARVVRAVGAALCFFGVVHDVVPFRWLRDAIDRGEVGLASEWDAGLGATRETVQIAWLAMGGDLVVLGVVLILAARELHTVFARRVVALVGAWFVCGYVTMWVLIEHAYPRPLPMPVLGLALLAAAFYAGRAPAAAP